MQNWPTRKIYHIRLWYRHFIDCTSQACFITESVADFPIIRNLVFSSIKFDSFIWNCVWNNQLEPDFLLKLNWNAFLFLNSGMALHLILFLWKYSSSLLDFSTLIVDQLSLINLGAIKSEMPKMSIWESGWSKILWWMRFEIRNGLL